MERKFGENLEFRQQYNDFMYESEYLGHLTFAKQNCIQYFLLKVLSPHYAVIKPFNITTKLRVTCDAFCKTSNSTFLRTVLCSPQVTKDKFWNFAWLSNSRSRHFGRHRENKPSSLGSRRRSKFLYQNKFLEGTGEIYPGSLDLPSH